MEFRLDSSTFESVEMEILLSIIDLFLLRLYVNFSVEFYMTQTNEIAYALLRQLYLNLVYIQTEISKLFITVIYKDTQ